MAATAGAEPIQIREPVASSRSPTGLQGPKDLGHPLLLSQATDSVLDGKQNSWDADRVLDGEQNSWDTDRAHIVSWPLEVQD